MTIVQHHVPTGVPVQPSHRPSRWAGSPRPSCARCSTPGPASGPMASIAIVSLLTTGAVILFADHEDLTYRTFTSAISVPMALILPIIAILSVTAEWSQRSGLTTFTLVPHRWRHHRRQAGRLRRRSPSSPRPSPSRSGRSATSRARPSPASTPCGTSPRPTCSRSSWPTSSGMLVGFMLGVLVRSSAGALVAYFIYQFLLPTLPLVLAAQQDWFRDLQPWVDFDFATGALLEGVVSAPEWAHLGAHRSDLARRPAGGRPAARRPGRGQVAALRQRTRLHGQDGGGAGEGAHPGDGVQHLVAAAADRQHQRGRRRGEGERQGAGDVQHPEVLGGVRRRRAARRRPTRGRRPCTGRSPGRSRPCPRGSRRSRRRPRSRRARRRTRPTRPRRRPSGGRCGPRAGPRPARRRRRRPPGRACPGRSAAGRRPRRSPGAPGGSTPGR